ncbi:MAG: hypothetical protein IPO27_06185 [Bacteroidetes bacterium]|nr:hypothetical protein [Bacteroidota bacterium]
MDEAQLEQNNPNPFSKQSVIEFYVPAKFHSAQLVVADMKGVPIKIFDINTAGTQQVIIHANEFAAGSYFYSLFLDGAKVATKKMELTK